MCAVAQWTTQPLIFDVAWASKPTATKAWGILKLA